MQINNKNNNKLYAALNVQDKKMTPSNKHD